MSFLKTLRQDIRSVYERDPAARNTWEILFCYPGLHAIWAHRLAHALWVRHVPFFPRFLSHLSRMVTGIEIHPGAVIGENLFIDHGSGIVIGETTIIGRHVTLYQGVTLGGTGKEKGKRHPTIGDNVVVACGAKILGNLHIGDGAKIGAGSVVLKNVPAGATVVGIPGRVVGAEKANAPACPLSADLEHQKLPDPEGDAIQALCRRVRELEKEVAELRRRADRDD